MPEDNDIEEQLARVHKRIEEELRQWVGEAPATVLRWGVFAPGYDGIPHQPVVDAIEEVLRFTARLGLHWEGSYEDPLVPSRRVGALDRAWRRIKGILLDEGRPLCVQEVGYPRGFAAANPLAMAVGSWGRAAVATDMFDEPASYEAAVDTALLGDVPIDDVLALAWAQTARLFSTLVSGTANVALDQGYLVGAGHATEPMQNWRRLTFGCGGGAYDVSKWVIDATWGTFLGPRQVKALGGVGAIRDEAPAFRVEETRLASRSPGEPGASLQLTEKLSECTPGRLEELRAYLEPVLPLAPGAEDREGRTLALARAADSLRRQLPRLRTSAGLEAERAIAAMEAEVAALRDGADATSAHGYCMTPGLQ
jgi:hypothetical protein